MFHVWLQIMAISSIYPTPATDLYIVPAEDFDFTNPIIFTVFQILADLTEDEKNLLAIETQDINSTPEIALKKGQFIQIIHENLIPRLQSEVSQFNMNGVIFKDFFKQLIFIDHSLFKFDEKDFLFWFPAGKKDFQNFQDFCSNLKSKLSFPLDFTDVQKDLFIFIFLYLQFIGFDVSQLILDRLYLLYEEGVISNFNKDFFQKDKDIQIANYFQTILNIGDYFLKFYWQLKKNNDFKPFLLSIKHVFSKKFSNISSNPSSFTKKEIIQHILDFAVFLFIFRFEFNSWPSKNQIG